MSSPDSHPPDQTARARLMFLLPLTMLLLLGFMLPHGGASVDVSQAVRAVDPLRWVLVALWLLIVLDSLPSLVAWRRPDARSARLRALLVILFPPLRAAIAPHVQGDWIWLPRAAWVKRDERAFHRLELGFAIPMLVIAVLILPVIAVEMLFETELETVPGLAFALHATTSIIWFGFAVEFLLLMPMASRKVEYALTHWVSLLIIALPLLAFLRPLLLLKMLQLGKGKRLIQTLRLRVLLVRAYRLALLLNLIERVLERWPPFYLRVLQARELRKQQELDLIRQRIVALQAKLPRPHGD
jgi:hypothetical protein